MEIQFSENKLIKLYIEIDDLLIAYKNYQARHEPKRQRRATRVPALSASEVATILVCYHHSGYKCFEYYYRSKILVALRSYFPDAPSYEGFLRYIPMVQDVLYLWLLYTCSQSKRTNLYFMDSKKLEVCHPKRQHSNKVFAHIARKGKSSMGWFFGLKLHLVINDLGQITAFDFTAGNVADNNQELLKKLLHGLHGCCVGDKGYLSKLFAFFYENKLHLLTKPRKNMKNRVVLPHHHLLLNKRGIIESVFDILTSVCDLEHSRHRSATNAFSHMIAALIAYQNLDHKPSLAISNYTARKITAA